MRKKLIPRSGQGYCSVVHRSTTPEPAGHLGLVTHAGVKTVVKTVEKRMVNRIMMMTAYDDCG